MMLKMLNGDEAMAYGAFHSGVKLVSGYPGSPSSGTVDTLIELARKHNIYVEWSSNEKVAMELAIGASIAGRRALVCVKSVGMNVMVDPLMTLNLTPVNGGLVILLGDDPGGYGSQNDQDTRPLASMLEIPMMEPSTPGEGYAMIKEAFQISEQYHTAMIIRETRGFTLHMEEIQMAESTDHKSGLDIAREPWRFVPVPRNAVEKHRELHQRISAIGSWVNGASFNQIIGKGMKGVLAAGYTYQKLLDVLGDEPANDLCLLKLSSIFPLPVDVIKKFLTDCSEILVFEENEPYLETHIKAIAHDIESRCKIYGKQSNHVNREGELFRWQIQESLNRFIPEIGLTSHYIKENEQNELPQRESRCGDCHYFEILDILDEAGKELNQKPVLIGDPGCLVTVADRLDAKFAIGSAVGVANGISITGINERSVALFGDSSFFHTSLPGICNAVHNRSDILMIVLDNGAAVTSGCQPNPGSGKNAMGHDSPVLSIEGIARACGIRHVYQADFGRSDLELKELFLEALTHRRLTLLIIKIE